MIEITPESNLTPKTLYDIVEKGLGGKVKISIEVKFIQKLPPQ